MIKIALTSVEIITLISAVSIVKNFDIEIDQFAW